MRTTFSAAFANWILVAGACTGSVRCATVQEPVHVHAPALEQADRRAAQVADVVADVVANPASESLAKAGESDLLDVAVSARDQGDLVAAEDALRRLLANAPTHPEAGLACTLLGQTLFEQVEYAAAADVLDDCPRTGPVADWTAWLRGEVHRGLGLPEVAAEDYEAVLAEPRSPLGPNAEFRRADAWFEAERCDQAVPAYRRLLDTFPEYPGAADVRFRIAQCAIDAGEPAIASSSLIELWQERPGSAVGVAAKSLLSALERQGVVQRQKTFEGELDRAARLRSERRWKEALKVLSGLERHLVDDSQRRTLFQLEARTLEDLDRYQDALEVIATAEQAGFHDLEDTRIRLLSKLGRTDEAVKRKQRRVGSQRERDRIAAEMYFRDGKYAEALALSRSLLARRKDVDSQWRLAWLEYRAGDALLAARSFARLAARPGVDEDQARYWQARAEAKAGHSATATRIFADIARQAPLSYYGIQAANRLLDLGDTTLYAEVTGARPGDIPMEEDRAKAMGGVAWNGADGQATYDQFTHQRRTRGLRSAALAFQGVPQLERALARYRMGLDDEARLELRIALSEIRRARRGSPKKLADTAGSLYMDYRPEKRGLWGSKIGRRLGLGPRQIAAEEVRLAGLKALPSNAESTLRGLLVEVGDPYWTRRTALRDLGRGQWQRPSSYTIDAFKGAYPIVFPERLAAETELRGVHPFLLTALMRVESGFNPMAVSNAGARGLLQVMPVTGRLIADRIGDAEFSPSDLLDAGTSIEYGSWYIGELLQKFRNQEPLAIIAYNAGPHRVHEWLRHRAGTSTDEFIEEVPYAQARKYVKSVLRTIGIYRRVHADRADLYVGQSLSAQYKSNINW